MKNQTDTTENPLVVAALDSEDLLTIFESALFALSDPRMASMVGHSMDETPERIRELRDKLESVMQTDAPMIFEIPPSFATVKS